MCDGKIVVGHFILAMVLLFGGLIIGYFSNEDHYYPKRKI